MIKEIYSCDGICSMRGECKGEVTKVRVTGGKKIDWDWGVFSYCQTAIQTDKKNGFTVTVLADDDEILH